MSGIQGEGAIMPPSTTRGARRLPGLCVLLLCVLAALIGPTGVAYGAATQPAGGTSSTAAAAAPAAAGGSATAKTTGQAGPAKAAKAAKATAAVKPTAPAKAQLPARPADEQKLRAAAVHSALAHTAAVPDTCSGTVVTDTVYPCTSPAAAGTDSYTLTLPSATDLLLVRAAGTDGNMLPISVIGPDGSAVGCRQPNWFQIPQCPTAQAGSYTVQVQNQGVASYTLALTALLSDTTCAVADPSFAAPALHSPLAAGATGACYTLAMASGSVLHAAVASAQFLQPIVAVFDATGAQVCIDDLGDCTLTGTAPYRVLAGDTYGNADTLSLQLNSVTQPQGCLTVAQQTYGTVPDTTSTVRCSALHVSTAGQYQIHAVTPDDAGVGSTLYLPGGTPTCSNSGPFCQLAVGDYNLVVSVDPAVTAHVGTVFIAANESRGCTTTGDTDFASGAATGGFQGVGEEVCLTLPTASGRADYMFDEPAADGNTVPTQVVDATGVPQCPNADFSYAICTLSGTAPFRAVLSAQAFNTSYRLLVQRTDSAAGCAVWPQSGYGGSWGAQVTLTASNKVGCLSIPANQHSTGEMIDYTNTANQVNGSINVYDPTGKQICFGNSTGICSYTPGVAYTALVSTVGSGDTYRVVRRDVSQTASCSAPVSTTVGGPSTAHVLISALDTVCERVTAAAADKLWIDVRATAPHPAGAVLQVADAKGAIVCRQWGVSCQVTGSTSYQVIVTAENYSGIGISAHVDTWRVGTAAGWAPQCTAHPLSVNGFGPQSGTLTETTTAYCAVVQMKPSQTIGVYGSGSGLPWVSVSASGSWTDPIGLCHGDNVGSFSYSCGTQSTDPAGQEVLLVTPYTSATPFSYYLQGVCRSGCTRPPAATLSSVSPAVGPAGSVDQVVLHGTGLSMGTAVSLATGGISAGNYRPVSVNSSGTALTGQLITYGVSPGSYDLVLDGASYVPGTPSPGYLPAAFRVTAAPTVPPGSRLVPVGPSRILDTRSGRGASKARVVAGGTVRLQVAGVAGVPSSGVTAVAMNVTAVAPVGAGYVTVFPDGQSRPTVSNLNFAAGQTIPNLVMVPVVDGKVDLYNGSGGAVDLLADIAGYYSAAGSTFQAVSPIRGMDTRSGAGGAGGAIAPGTAAVLNISDLPGAPVASNVISVVLNVTVTAPQKAGYVTVLPDGQPLPTVSNLNFSAGQTIPNLVVVPVVDGAIDFYNGSGGTVQVIADVDGWYTS